MTTKAELRERIDELQTNLDTLVGIVNTLIEKNEDAYERLSLALQSHVVYFAQHDKNIMVHDNLINKLCTNIGIVLEQSKQDLN